MNLTKCPTCKRIVPATRKTRAESINGTLTIETRLTPQPHLIHADVFTPDVCKMDAEMRAA